MRVLDIPQAAVLRAMTEGGEVPAVVRRAATRFADAMVLGAFRVARARGERQRHSMVPPVTLVAVGAYGRRMPTTAGGPERMILVGADADCSVTALINDGLELLESPDFAVDYSVPTIESTLGAVMTDPALAARSRRSRLLWGRSDHWARLRPSTGDALAFGAPRCVARRA